MQIWSGGNGVLAFQMYNYPNGISIATDPNLFLLTNGIILYVLMMVVQILVI